MYEGHGMTRQIALDAANDVMREPEAALAVHAREELGVDPNELGSPWSAAGLSLVCFLVGALLPVIPWFAGSGDSAKVASILIGVVAAAIVGSDDRQVRRAPAVVERDPPGADPVDRVRRDLPRRQGARRQRQLGASSPDYSPFVRWRPGVICRITRSLAISPW